MYSRHRPRFFRLLRLCLQSTHVPAYVVAAFMKKLVGGGGRKDGREVSCLPSYPFFPSQSILFRLCRLALLAPPPTVIFILGICTMLLKKHPQCNALVHRPPQPSTSTTGPLQLGDGFDADADDPAEALTDGES